MLLEEIESPQLKIFVDLDGVLADFDKKIFDISGKSTKELSKKEIFDIAGQYVKDGGRFFFEMEKMTDANKLWKFVKKFDHAILSASATSIPSSVQDKKDWVKKHLGKVETIIVGSGVSKGKFAKPNYILIDDRKDVIAAWKAAGGIPILHTSANKSISELKKLGLK